MTIELCDFIQTALKAHASDIHLDPKANHYLLRFRIDGLVHDIEIIENTLALPLISQIKLLAQLDISEKRKPQDGQLQLANLEQLSLRISTMATQFGERLVIRLLNQAAQTIQLENLGLTSQQFNGLQNALRQQQGLILITGPTGSGKSTTAYAALNELKQLHKNIISIEDPIEMTLDHINQCSVQPKLNLGFAEILKTSLRQDPDVIMLGEIRDTQSAAITLQAAQTGHLVISTLHTKSSKDSMQRLKSLGANIDDIRSNLLLVINQRLLPKLCQRCKIKHPLNDQAYPNLQHHFTAPGCEHCREGYFGRVALFELWWPTKPLTSTLAQHGLAMIENGFIDYTQLQTYCPTLGNTPSAHQCLNKVA